MKRLLIIASLFVIGLLIITVAVVSHQSLSPVHVITIFKSEPGNRPPPGGWAIVQQANPYPPWIQVFNQGDKIYLSLVISKELDTSVTFSKYTFVNNVTNIEVETGSSSDYGPFEPGQKLDVAFDNPWPVPSETGFYQFRIYLGNKVVASALFEVR